MAVNKNFVVKNGLEVGTDIIVASVDNKNVGVGTTVGQVLLDVRGAIGATHLSVSGVGTVVTLNSTNLTGTAGTITTLTSTDSTITNGTITNLTGTAGTVTTFESTNGTITNLTGTAATITTIEATSGTFSTITSTNGNITNGSIIYLTGTASTITNLTSTNLTGTAGTITTLTSTNGTITNGTITNLTGTAATITTVEATNGSITNFTPTNVNASGVVTATSFVGDGSGITGVLASDSYWIKNDAGIHTTGSVGVGTTNPNSVVPSDNTSILNVGILTAYKLYGDGSALTGLAGNPALQTVLDEGNTSTTGMSITGVSTFTTAEVTNLTPTNINSSGVTTVTTLEVQTNFDVYDSEATFYNDVYIAGNLSIGGTATSFTTQDLKIIDADIVLGVTTATNGDDVSTDTTANHGGIAVASTEGSPLVDLVVAGIETLPVTYKKIMWFKAGTFSGLGTDAWLSNYAVGIGSTQFSTGTRLAAGRIQLTDNVITTPTVTIGSGIITATSGIVTYYGDGSNLTNIVSGVGINTIGGNVGYGATLLDFRGSGISTVTFDSATGIGTINIQGESAQIIKETFPVTGVTTTFNLASAYTTGYIDVYLNGIKLNSSDFTETDSTTIDLASPATDGDILEVVNFETTSGYVYSIATYASTAGVSTLSTTSEGLTGTPDITVGTVTANTYYGDGSNLDGLSLGIRTEGAVVGYGVTLLDLRGSGVSTAYYNANVGVATVYFEGGSSSGVFKSAFTAALLFRR